MQHLVLVSSDVEKLLGSCLVIILIGTVVECSVIFAVLVQRFQILISSKLICTLMVYCFKFIHILIGWLLVECYNPLEYQSALSSIPEGFSLYYVYYVSSFNKISKIVTNAPTMNTVIIMIFARALPMGKFTFTATKECVPLCEFKHNVLF
jgi:hypothetical protein